MLRWIKTILCRVDKAEISAEIKEDPLQGRYNRNQRRSFTGYTKQKSKKILYRVHKTEINAETNPETNAEIKEDPLQGM